MVTILFVGLHHQITQTKKNHEQVHYTRKTFDCIYRNRTASIVRYYLQSILGQMVNYRHTQYTPFRIIGVIVIGTLIILYAANLRTNTSSDNQIQYTVK